eukprot:snap_masked-scaffold_8-processed-gene-3.48-mRNA-1 protein AED:1.00 eAED:1.00 QI:0/0/0/0/1/1/2/0/537
MKVQNTTSQTIPCMNEQLLRTSDGFRIFSLLYFTFFICLFAVSLGFWFVKRKDPYLEKRSFFDACLIVFGGLCNLIATSFVRTTAEEFKTSGFETYSFIQKCGVVTTVYNLIIPVLLSVQFIRVFQWLQNIKLNESLSKFHEKNSRFFMKEIETRATAKPSLTTSSLTTTFDKDKSEIIELMFFTRRRVKVFLLLILLLISFIYALIPAFYSCPEMGLTEKCRANDVSNISVITILFNGLPTVLFFWFFYFVRKLSQKYPDPFEFLTEITEAFFIGTVLSLLSIVLVVLDFGDIYNEEKPYRFDYGVISGVGVMLFVIRSITIPVYRVYKLSQLTKEKSLHLDALLSTPTGAKFFRSHLVYEFSVENLNFYETVNAWKQNYRKFINPKKSAKNIYNRFISEKAMETGQVNLSYEIKETIRRRIEEENGVDVDIFDEALEEVYMLMSNDSYGRFQNTETFKGFMGTGTIESPNNPSFYESSGHPLSLALKTYHFVINYQAKSASKLSRFDFPFCIGILVSRQKGSYYPAARIFSKEID